MAFERFIPPKAAGSRPKVTIRPTGLISFDANAVAAFGLDKATHAVLYFDKARKIVGVKPTTNEKDQGAIRLARRRRSVSLKAPHFFANYAITFDEPQRFEVIRDDSDNMLVISMKHVQRRRGRRPKHL